jgi:fatty acid desaturase
MTTSPRALFKEGARLASSLPRASNLMGLRDLALPCALVAIAFTLLLQTHFNLFACVLGFFIISKAQYSLLLSGHEATHYLLFTDKRLNDLAGRYLCFAPMGVGFNIARAAHLDHHKYLLTEKDVKLDQQIANPTKRKFILHILRPLFGYYLIKGGLRIFGVTVESRVKPVYVVTPAQRQADQLSIIFTSLTLLVLFSALDWRLYLIFWLGPLFTLLAFLHNMRAMLDHMRMPDEPEGLLYSYKIRWFDRLLIGTQQYRHAEHHLYPHVPHHKLARLEPITRQMPSVAYRRSTLGCLIRYYRMLPAGEQA